MAHLIDKDALVAEINRLIAELVEKGEGTMFEQGRISAFEDAKLFLDTLEVKEVDLNDEYIEEIYSHIDGIKDTADRMTSGNFMHHRAAIKFSANVIGQVLGLIGLKRQKGE